ncbi:arsinothricin resistance N-acetyltransferase ArsN1 family A [Paenibacillus arenosi]|uniref:N-acetyltransferase n=1 Tax=Paenibacillus arenosi TaxID=2774142 RepID=A0ABR9AZ84_9BACL|nr:arsinothricin resistance N-acetyltransferase ArsN1 family A [Paenibacillus arenosi]MBD8499211.1 N-acetyltransferase [Paenibacillus arenosi]
MKIEVRRATIEDAAELADIYNYNIVHERNSTFESEPKTIENRVKWIEDSGNQYPILVGVSDNVIVGTAYVSSYRETRACYKGVGEFSIYIHQNYRGKGIGKQLLGALIEECEKLHYWKLLSRIFDYNIGSRQLCNSLGFREVGVYEKHSQLDGKWLDVVIVEKLFPNNLQI